MTRENAARSSCRKTRSGAAERIAFASLILAARSDASPVAGGTAEARTSRSGRAFSTASRSASAPELAEEGVGIVAAREGDVKDADAPLDEEREGLPGGREARRVAVVGDDDGGDLPGEEVGLRGRQRRSHRGDGPRDARPLERDPVEVPLAEDELLALPRPLARPVEAVEDLPLREAGRLGAVDVLGRVVAERRGRRTRGSRRARRGSRASGGCGSGRRRAPCPGSSGGARPRGGPPR